MSEPETAAGRALRERESLNSRSFALITPETILAIEAEVRATLAAKVRALPGVSIGEGIYPEYVRREYVLALIEGSDPASPDQEATDG